MFFENWAALNVIVMSKTLLGKEMPQNWYVINNQLGFLRGKILTLIEASISNPEQQKAVKDLAKSIFNEQASWICQLYYPETQIRSREEVKASGEDVDEIERSAQVVH